MHDPGRGLALVFCREQIFGGGHRHFILRVDRLFSVERHVFLFFFRGKWLRVVFRHLDVVLTGLRSVARRERGELLFANSGRTGRKAAVLDASGGRKASNR
jgi:hypothetical protein